MTFARGTHRWVARFRHPVAKTSGDQDTREYLHDKSIPAERCIRRSSPWACDGCTGDAGFGPHAVAEIAQHRKWRRCRTGLLAALSLGEALRPISLLVGPPLLVMGSAVDKVPAGSIAITRRRRVLSIVVSSARRAQGMHRQRTGDEVVRRRCHVVRLAQSRDRAGKPGDFQWLAGHEIVTHGRGHAGRHAVDQF